MNELEDSAFAFIEPGGNFDEERKTVPRASRHFPHHMPDGSVDVEALREFLQQPHDTKFWAESAAHLLRHAKAAGLLGAPVGTVHVSTDKDDAHDSLWHRDTAPAHLLTIFAKGQDIAEAIVAEQRAYGQLGIDTKTGRRISAEKLGRIKEVISHLQEVVNWAELVDRGEDGKAVMDWYRLQSAIFELSLEEVA